MPDYFIRVLFKQVGADVSKAPAILVTGAAPTITMTAGGNVVMGLSSASGALSAVKGGLVRALVISSKERDPDFPGVPSCAELGFPLAISWNGISGPPHLPSHIVAAWAKIMQESVNDPEFIAALRKIGAGPFYQDPQGMRDFVKNEIDEASKLFGATK
jgi:tripartite-type tricarboxylate transporter receptor subunit TctC